jgi:hypothetical protein
MLIAGITWPARLFFIFSLNVVNLFFKAGYIFVSYYSTLLEHLLFRLSLKSMMPLLAPGKIVTRRQLGRYGAWFLMLLLVLVSKFGDFSGVVCVLRVIIISKLVSQLYLVFQSSWFLENDSATIQRLKKHGATQISLCYIYRYILFQMSGI